MGPYGRNKKGKKINLRAIVLIVEFHKGISSTKILLIRKIRHLM